ncbi:MAG: PEP-CTERM sorting domain-containing protein [Armatimonadetes bacterium]|nr:PEP-CTERM sorting domain-containing protein [Armatimonadota bacterium]
MIKRIAILACVLSLTVSHAVMAKERTPGGSFLKYRACTVSELKSEIAQDSAARTRYAQHFRSTPGELESYLNDGVKLVALKSPTRVQMYYVGKGGAIRIKTKLLPKGSYVFASADGTPFLAWSCGNPLRASLPARMASKPAKKAVKTASKPTGAVAAPGLSKSPEPFAALAPETPAPVPETMAQGAANATKAIETKVLPAPVEIITNAAVTAPPDLVMALAPAVASAGPLAAMPIAGAAAMPATAAIAPAAIGGGGGGLGWLGGLAGLGGALAALGGGGGGNDGPAPAILPPTDDNPPVTPPVVPPTDTLVPEPSSLLALATALSFAGAFGARFRASNRKG